MFVFEPPPGVKANLLRTFSAVSAVRMCKVSKNVLLETVRGQISVLDLKMELFHRVKGLTLQVLIKIRDLFIYRLYEIFSICRAVLSGGAVQFSISPTIRNCVIFSLCFVFFRHPVSEPGCISCWPGSMPLFKSACVTCLLVGPSVTSSASLTCEWPVTLWTRGWMQSLRCVTSESYNATCKH